VEEEEEEEEDDDDDHDDDDDDVLRSRAIVQAVNCLYADNRAQPLPVHFAAYGDQNGIHFEKFSSSNS
jgi:hypothetical protein